MKRFHRAKPRKMRKMRTRKRGKCAGKSGLRNLVYLLVCQGGTSAERICFSIPKQKWKQKVKRKIRKARAPKPPRKMLCPVQRPKSFSPALFHSFAPAVSNPVSNFDFISQRESNLISCPKELGLVVENNIWDEEGNVLQCCLLQDTADPKFSHCRRMVMFHQTTDVLNEHFHAPQRYPEGPARHFDVSRQKFPIVSRQFLTRKYPRVS